MIPASPSPFPFVPIGVHSRFTFRNPDCPSKQLKTVQTQSTVRPVNLKHAVSIFLSSLVLVGCNQPETSAPQNETKTVADSGLQIPGTPQPKLQTIPLYIGDQVMSTELAYRPHEIQTGMMFRTNMAENEGMLFIFGGPHRASFWMKNTLIPLSAAYISPEGVIEEIHNLEPHNTNAVVATSTNIQYVLETPQGWFTRHNIETGFVIKTERGSLSETFFQKR